MVQVGNHNMFQEYINKKIVEQVKYCGILSLTWDKLESLLQCLELIEDGDIISPNTRDYWCNLEYIDRFDGYNIINQKGIKFLIDNKILWS